jgi:hypothetical protein
MLAFYKWVKLVLHRIDRKFFWDEIKTVLGEIIREKLKGLKKKKIEILFEHDLVFF